MFGREGGGGEEPRGEKELEFEGFGKGFLDPKRKGEQQNLVDEDDEDDDEDSDAPPSLEVAEDDEDSDGPPSLEVAEDDEDSNMGRRVQRIKKMRIKNEIN